MCQLVIDIGNSRVKYGVFSHDMLVAQAVKDTLTSEDILQLLTNHPIENIIYSSVAASESRLLSENMTAQVPVMELKADTPLPIDNEYGTPATLGKDRLAAAVGAASQYAGHHCLVVDAGTCMTLDLVLWDETRQRSVYKGGNISPGVQMRLKAMHQFTARLPMVSVQADWQGWIGQSTQTALQNGGVLGAALEVEALTQRLENQWPDLHLILTGGDAALLAGHVMVKSSMFVNQNLVLIGLQQILAYNVKK